MESGRRRALRTEPSPRASGRGEAPAAARRGRAFVASGREKAFAAARPRAAALFCAVALCASLALSSCGKLIEGARDRAFSSSLADIDAAIAARAASSSLSQAEKRKLDAAFSRALSIAGTDSQWLSLMKRSRSAEAFGESGRWASVADRALAARPKSEPVAAAAAQAYLRSGRPGKALALFGGSLSRATRPALWAEAFISAAESGAAPTATSADYAALASITGDSRAYLGAAAMALAARDRPAAASWLERAIAAGLSPSAELMWDCGLYGELSSSPDLGSGSRDLALMGDAAWLSGAEPLALRRWERSLALAPRRSYKSYEKLALVSEGEAAKSYWARLGAAFLSGPASAERDGALASYAARLAREGRADEALALLRGGGVEGSGSLAVLELAIRSGRMPEGRLVAQYEALAAERPEDPEVAGEVLRVLSLRGRYEELALLLEGASRRGVRLEYGWYYEAEVLAARGRFAEAAELLASRGGAGPEAPFALGSLRYALGDSVAAAEAYAKAAAAAGSAAERCAAYKALGRVLGSSGDGEGAARAYRAALAASPSDAEAAMLARQSAPRAAPGAGASTAGAKN